MHLALSPCGARADAHYKWASRYAGLGDEARSLSHLRSAARYRATAFGAQAESDTAEGPDFETESISRSLREHAMPFESRIPNELFEHILHRNGRISTTLFNAHYAKQAYADIDDARNAVALRGDFDAFFAKLKERDAKAAAEKEQKRLKEKAGEAEARRVYELTHHITRPGVAPTETFLVEVRTSKHGEKVYFCPVCKRQTGTHAVENAKDPRAFGHLHIESQSGQYSMCPNNGKIPEEPVEDRTEPAVQT